MFSCSHTPLLPKRQFNRFAPLWTKRWHFPLQSKLIIYGDSRSPVEHLIRQGSLSKPPISCPQHVPEHFSNSGQWKSHRDPGLLAMVEGQAAAEAAPGWACSSDPRPHFAPRAAPHGWEMLSHILSPFPSHVSIWQLRHAWAGPRVWTTTVTFMGGWRTQTPHIIPIICAGEKKILNLHYSKISNNPTKKKKHDDVNAFLQYFRKKKLHPQG